jgi:hypothetical protein
VGNNVGNSGAHDPLMASRAAPPLRHFDHRRGRSAHQNSGCPEAEDCARRRPRCVYGRNRGTSTAFPTGQQSSSSRIPFGARSGARRDGWRSRTSTEQGLRMLPVRIPVRTLASASVGKDAGRTAKAHGHPSWVSPTAAVPPTINVGPLLAGITGQQPARVRRPFERVIRNVVRWPR